MYSGTGVIGGLGALGLGEDAWQWMAPPGDPYIVRYQQAANKELVARGFMPMGTDGQLGPKTCGVIAWLGTLSDVDYGANPDLNLVSYLVSSDGANAAQSNPCKAFTYPTKVGGQVFKPPSTFSSQLPWCASDPGTTQVQLDVNDQLTGHGYQTGPTDGKMCADTCGGMKLSSDEWGVDFMSAYGQNCQSFTMPAKRAVAAPPAPPKPVVVGPVTPMPVRKSSEAWMVGGLIGAAVIAGVVVASKKRRH